MQGRQHCLLGRLLPIYDQLSMLLLPMLEDPSLLWCCLLSISNVAHPSMYVNCNNAHAQLQ